MQPNRSTENVNDVVEPLTYDALVQRRDQLLGKVPCDVPAGLPQPRSITAFRLSYLEDLARASGLTPAQREALALPTPAPSVIGKVINTPHFTITYDTTGPDAVSDQIAQDVSTALEGGLVNFNGYFGVQVTSKTAVHFDADKFHYTDPTTGIHFLADGFRTTANNLPSRNQIAVHECFHVWQFFVGWRTTRGTETLNWLLEGTAVWAALKWTGPQPSLNSPFYLTYWFTHPTEVLLATQKKTAAVGYVALPFWMWVEGEYPGAMRAFLRQLPTGATLVVDALAQAMDRTKTIEALVCEFGGNLVLGNWNPLYAAISNIEQPLVQPIAIPAWVGDQSPDFMQELLQQGSTWNASDTIPAATVYFYHAQFRLRNQDPSKTWVADMDISSLTGDGSVVAYYVLILAGVWRDVAQGQWTVPVSQAFDTPTNADVYFIISGNQHPPNVRFKSSFTAQFQWT
jgi:hypothetical protein